MLAIILEEIKQILEVGWEFNMGKLISTSTVLKHYHTGYISEKDGTGNTSFDNKHLHRIVFQDGEIKILPENNHTHEIMPIIAKKNVKIKENKDDTIARCYKLYQEVAYYEEEFRKRGNLSKKFFLSDQWDKDTITDMKERRKAHSTVNKIKRVVLALSGYQRQNRTDLKYLPMEQGDAVSADILNILSKHITDKSDFSGKETLAFTDAQVTGRGTLDIYISTNLKKDPEIKIRKLRWDGIYYGPHDEEDLSDLDFVIKTVSFSRDQLENMYPDKKEDLESCFKYFNNTLENEFEVSRFDKIIPNSISLDIFNKGKEKLTVFEVWEKKYVRIPVIIMEDDAFFMEAQDLNSQDLKKIKTIPGITVDYELDNTMEVRTIAGGVVLDVRESVFKDFTVVPIYSLKFDDHIDGIVYDLIGTQEEINKRHSQIMDVYNFFNSYNYIIDGNTFADDGKKIDFMRNSNSPGYITEVADKQNNKPEVMPHPPFPSELVNGLAMCTNELYEVASASPELMGMGSNARSGTAISSRVRQTLTTLEYLFDNLANAKKRLGKILIKAIQEFYTVDRMIRIIRSSEKNKQTIAGTPISEYSDEVLAGILSNIDLEQYDITISEAPSSPSKALERYESFINLMQSGAISNIPEMALDMARSAGIISPEDVEKFNGYIQNAREQEQAINASKQNTEIAKTAIAHGQMQPQQQNIAQSPQ